MQLARIYHGHTTGILTVVSKNPLPFFSFRFSSIFFTTGTAVVFPFHVFVWLLLIVKAKINKQTNKQKKSGSCQFARRYSHQRHVARLSSFFILQDRRRKGKKNVSLLCFILFKSEVTDYQKRMTGTVSNSLEIQQEMNEP
jgi:hypothetical protein